MSKWQKGVSYEEKYGEIDSQIIKEKLSIFKKNKTPVNGWYINYGKILNKSYKAQFAI